jgi:hypothetical protein
MVEDLCRKKYVCPGCNQEYDHREDAEECVIEHATIKEHDINLFGCEMCLDSYRWKSKAIECESKHKECEDKYYLRYMDKLSRARLIDAGTHPAQKPLVVFNR